jgi:hypothetical protein
MKRRWIVLIKKEYDTRTHEQRLTELRIAFAECKANAYVSKKVNSCSATKVLTQAKVDRSYLYTNKLKDKTIQAAYHQVAKDIKDWRDDFQDTKGTVEENTALAKAEASITKLTKERDASHEQNAGYLSQVQRFKARHDLMLDEKNILINQQTYAAYDTPQSQSAASVINVNFNEATVISPDRHLYVNGKYSFYDKNVVDAAWRISRDELQKALSKQQQTRIYMLVGPPCSGKSHWVKNPDLYMGAYRPIIIDACNLTQAERHKWFRIIESSKSDCRICAVFFDTPLSELFSRNNQRSPDKQMTDVEIEKKFKSLESVDIFEESYIDEIKVVRDESD